MARGAFPGQSTIGGGGEDPGTCPPDPAKIYLGLDYNEQMRLLLTNRQLKKYRQANEALTDAGILASADVLDEDEEAFSTTLTEDPQNLAEEAGMDSDVKGEEFDGNRGDVVLCDGVRRRTHEQARRRSVCVEVLKEERIFEEESGLLCYEETSLLREYYEFDDGVATKLMPLL